MSERIYGAIHMDHPHTTVRAIGDFDPFEDDDLPDSLVVVQLVRRTIPRSPAGTPLPWNIASVAPTRPLVPPSGR